MRKDNIRHALLTMCSTSWMPAIYFIDTRYDLCGIPDWFIRTLIVVVIFIISIMGTFIILRTMASLNPEKMDECNEFELADNEFLPVYLGYFFVALSVNDLYSLLVVYFIVFAFAYITGDQYFNPIFLLLGYHYYLVITNYGTKIYVITKGSVIKDKNKAKFYDLRRINDTTFINIDNSKRERKPVHD